MRGKDATARKRTFCVYFSIRRCGSFGKNGIFVVDRPVSDMRKLLVILIALAGCLLFTEQPAGAWSAPQASHEGTVALSAANTLAREWACERSDNSDLNQIRPVRVAEARSVDLPAGRSFPGQTLLAAARHMARCGLGWNVDQRIATRFLSLSAGGRCADYYVYRLRRLLI